MSIKLKFDDIAEFEDFLNLFNSDCNNDVVHGILDRIEENMATKQDFETLLAAVDEATNKIAARIQALTDKLGQGGMTAEEEAAIKTSLEAEVAKLQALGADPENPVPPTV